MNERSDHLIERAAALLRSANAAQTAEPAPTPAAATTPAARAPQPPSSRALGAGAPKLEVPSRAIPPVRRPTVPVRSGSLADLRLQSKHPPIDLQALELAGLMVARNGRTRTTEEYRIVIGRVLRALHEEPEVESAQPVLARNAIMVTSARPGEGKSFTALNLSGSVAQNAGESVLLVDVDAKHNSLTDHLGMSNRPGFLEMTHDDQLSPDDLIVPTELPNLAFLPLGHGLAPRTEDSEEGALRGGRQLGPTLARLSQRFPKSLIILDTPPCLSTSDPHTFASSVGQVVMVVEAERTQRTEVEAALDLVHACPTITMLLNKVRMSSGHSFGSYDYFGSYT